MNQDYLAYKKGGVVNAQTALDNKMIKKLQKGFEGKDLWDDEILDKYEVKQFDDRTNPGEIDKFVNSKKKKFYVVPFDYGDDSYYYILVPKNKMANGGSLADTPESFPSTDAMSYKDGGGVDKLPPAKIYGENLGKAIEKFNITESEARKRYGNFTISQWKELLEDKMANGGSTSGWCYSIGGL
jgi:hypothetical protein